MIGTKGWQRYAPALICLATLLAYSGAFRCPFEFDDEGAILTNPTIRHVWTALVPPGDGSAVQRRPIANLSLALNYAISGVDVWSYHVFNVAAHMAAALLLFGIARRTWPAGGARSAFAIAILWAVHPLLTDAVTYVSQRTEVLAGLFALLTIYCVIRGWNLMAVTACALAVGSKESALLVPVIVVFYDRAFLGKRWSDRWKLYAGLAATWTIPILMLPHGNEGTAVFGRGVESLEYLLVQCGVIVHYLRLSFWPAPLVCDYGFPHSPSPMEVIPSLLIIIALLAGIVVAWRYQPWLGFLGIWFFAILAPSSSIIPVAQQVAAEKRMYLPLAAVVVLAVVVARRMRCPGWLAVPAVVLLTALTFQRNLDYESPVTLWADTATKLPQNARACNNLGVALGREGHFEEAATFCRAAIRLDPNYADAYNNLGIALHKLGNRNQASACLRRASQLYSRNSR
ncbi:MAG: tetratricopeptide repeat protein [Thermoguttaceae bacterium]